MNRDKLGATIIMLENEIEFYEEVIATPRAHRNAKALARKSMLDRKLRLNKLHEQMKEMKDVINR